VDEIQDILSNLPMLNSEGEFDRSLKRESNPPLPLDPLPAASDLGLRFLSEVLGSSQASDISKLLKLSETELEHYRTNIQSLQLTAIQMRLLGAIDEYKISNAPLKDIVAAFKTLKDKELVMSGKPTEIHGLAGYLMYLERDPQLQEINGSSATEAEVLPNL